MTPLYTHYRHEFVQKWDKGHAAKLPTGNNDYKPRDFGIPDAWTKILMGQNIQCMYYISHEPGMSIRESQLVSLIH